MLNVQCGPQGPIGRVKVPKTGATIDVASNRDREVRSNLQEENEAMEEKNRRFPSGFA